MLLRRTQKALLKQQYENSMLHAQIFRLFFNRLQKVVSDCNSWYRYFSLEDLNVKFVRRLTLLEWVRMVGFSDATVYAFLSTQPQGSQLVHEDLEQIHDDDLEEMDLMIGLVEKNAFKCKVIRSILMGLVRLNLKKLGGKEGVEFNCFPITSSLNSQTNPTPLDLSYSGLEEFKQPEINWYGPRDSSSKPTTVCDRESNNSKENTDDPLTQQPKSVTETSSVVPTLKVDKKWKEKFFNHANNVRLEEPKKARENTDAPIIEDWVSDDEEEVESTPKVEKKIPTATKKESVNTVKPSRRTVRYAEMYRSQRPRGNQRSWNGQKTDQLGCNFVFNNKACFICGDFDHIQYYCPNAYKHMVPRAVLMKTGLKTVKNAKPLSTVRSVNTARPVSTARCVKTVRPNNTAHPNSTVSCARPKSHFQNKAQLIDQRPFFKNTALTNRSNIQNINTGRQTVNTVRPNVNTVRARGFNAVKPSACWVWRPIKPNGASLSNSQLNEKGFVDSGCSRHMSGNIAHLSDFKEFDGGYVTFGGGANGGRITGKGTIKTDKLDFEDVYFVKELKFNLFSVSQMCDKKNYVLFTDSECLVLSPNFKLPDESQVLLKIPRQNNMYSFDMKNIVPKDGLTCLVAKATSEESMLWHRRLGHVNFKNINKLVKENLVRDLPLKRFENDQTCVACLKGKQHRASCKSKAFSPITKPLFMLHMDLFGPTFVSSLMHKKYCLVVTDDYSRFSWVFFLRTKDETSEILKNFIKEIENLVDKKVKIIRSDNGTEFKNHVMDEFCREKGIKREYSVARTPQQNGVAERKNRTLIEAARTMLADSKLPTTFWAEAVSTACYVQNRVLVVKPHNKTPYELFRGIKPAIGFMKPFGCHVTILNTLDKLGKFDGKSDEGFFVGYSLSSKAFRVYNITMLDATEPSPSPSRITSSPSPTPTPSPSPQPSPTQPSPTQPSPTQPSPTQPGSANQPPTPHDSPLHAVHSHGSEEGSLKLQELMNLINTLSDRIGVLEADLTKTKKTYSSAYTKLILRVKKLETQLKVGKARRHSRFVLSDTEVGEDDSSKQGRKFSTEGVQDDEGVHEKASNDTELFVQEVTPTELIQDQEASGKASDEVSTAGLKKGTAREEVPTVSTAEATLSTAGGTVTYSRRSAEKRSRKDKGKAILIEEEPKKKSKKDIEQEQLSFAEAIRLEEQMHEEQRAQIARDAEIARQWDEEERKRAMDEAKSTKKIDWNDPSVLRYHSLKMKPKSIAQARRNMIKYLKNQGNFKITDFKGMSYNEVRPIFEKLWDFNQKFMPMDTEKASKMQKSC
ncbi:putative ribonuclease H-like domain-containing protein [Tanacetum coccineum]